MKVMKNDMKVMKLDFRTAQKEQPVQRMFDNLNNYTDMVINGIQPSLLLTGGPGLGKTFLVKKRLEKANLHEGVDFVHVKGRTTPAGMYMTLYENSDKLVIFDDCDSVFKDAEAVNMLKAALDSYDERVISYITTKPIKDADGEYLPRYFTFTGKVIFISNLKQKQVDSAIRSRSFVVDIDLEPEQLIERMDNLLETIEPQVDLQIKKEALGVLERTFYGYNDVALNFRSLIKAIRIRQMGFEGWETMVAEQCIEVKK